MFAFLLLSRVFVLAQLMAIPQFGRSAAAPSPSPAQANPSSVQSSNGNGPATDVQTGSSSPAPAAVQHKSAVKDPDNIADAFDHWTIGKLFKGQKKLSPEDLGHVEFWVALVKEPLLTAVSFVPRLFVAAIFVILFWGINRGIRRLLSASMGKAGVDPSIRDMLAHLIKWGVLGFGLVIAFNQIGIQITALLTGVSIVGLAIGLAAQETLANFIAGIVIFWDKPFRVGDWVEIDSVGGAVQRVTFRSTRMLTADGEIVVWPNTTVLAHKLANHSANASGRVNIHVSISYRSSVEAARQVLIGMLAGDQRIAETPAPSVVVTELGDSAVKLSLRFWVKDRSQRVPAQFEYLEKAKESLESAGIEIPFPHMQLLLDRNPVEQTRGLRAAG